MSAAPLAILRTGLVTSVGLSAPASCAAIRAKLSNPTETRFIDSSGEWIVAHAVPLEPQRRGLAKLARMAAMAIDECLADLPLDSWAGIPLLMCVAEAERPGRTDGLDDQLLLDVRQELGGVSFSSDSAVVAHGRVSVPVALVKARTLIGERKHPRVLIAATDSLITWPTLSHYERAGRLLTANNSNGFMAGEGAGALLVGDPTGQPELLCSGLGFALEKAHVESEEPMRAEGLSLAIKAALADAGVQMHEMDYRITDASGEQYYFKEAALALTRTLHQRKEEFDLWHPAECTGEPGAVAGVSVIALADAACRKAYARGSGIVAHFANDAGQRAAISLHFRSA